MAESRTTRFHGRLPPDRGADWQVSTVAYRTTNRDSATVCAVTGANVPLSAPHYYITLRHPTPGRHQPPEYDHLVVRAGALDELDEWLEEKEG